MKKNLRYLIYILPIIVICYIIYNSITITFEKRIMGRKWQLIDIKIESKEGTQLNKLTPKAQEKLDEIKKMSSQESKGLILEFGENKKMSVISAKGKPRPYKIIENEHTEIDVEDAEGEISIKKAVSFTFKNKLEIAIKLTENGDKIARMTFQEL